MTYRATTSFADLLPVEPLENSGAVPFVAVPMASAYAEFVITGNSSNQSLIAIEGQPVVVGMGGSDTITGDDADNILAGDFFDPAYFDYYFDGVGPLPTFNSSMKGNDFLYGGSGDDAIFCDYGDDQVFGGSGNDRFIIYVEKPGADQFNGGSGDSDLIFLADDWNLGFDHFVIADLNLSKSRGVEGFVTNGYEIWGTDDANRFDLSGVRFQSLSQNENVLSPTIDLRGGHDTYIGTSGEDIVLGGNGHDTISGGKGGWSNVDGIQSNFNTLYGGDGNDVLKGDATNDQLYGGTGADHMTGSSGDDFYDVQSKGDTVVENDAPGHDTVSVSLTTYILPAHCEVLIYSGTKDFTGSGELVDVVSITSGSGDDFLTGAQAKSVLIGGLGDDTLSAAGREATVNGGAGDDTYILDKSLQFFVIAEDVKGGFDEIQTNEAHFALYNTQNIEALSYIGNGDFSAEGSGASDHITGGGGDDFIQGLLGHDSLVGGGGRDELFGFDENDTLSGGLGKDSLTGELGRDVFVFDSTLDGTNVDQILDFNSPEDTIWLKKSGVDLFNSLALGTLSADKFKELGTSLVDANDRILYDKGTGKLYYDEDGSGLAERILFATLVPDTNLTAADFFVI